jgi:hypothetical protein
MTALIAKITSLQIENNDKLNYYENEKVEPEQEPNIFFHTYRFKYTNSLTEELMYFSKLHQYDDRNLFKDEWNIWIKTPEISNLINTEIERLTIDGQKGDLLDKIYKSARYYYRKKCDTQLSTIRKTNISFSPQFLDFIDTNIKSQIFHNICDKTNNPSSNDPYYNDISTDLNKHAKNKQSTIIISSNLTPANAYSAFYKDNIELIQKEITTLINKGEDTDPDKMEFKIKKTFKNRLLSLKNKILQN